MGIQSRIDIQVSRICHAAQIGNIYINRSQIGAVVGVQLFGRKGLSGTGSKAGDPHYLKRFYRTAEGTMAADESPGIACDVDNKINLMHLFLNSWVNLQHAQILWSEYNERLMLLNSIIQEMPQKPADIARSACEIDQSLSFIPRLLTGSTGESN